MTLLPVPIADFRANLKKYADMLRGGDLEILVTNHGKAILRCLTPDDVLPEVENPPGVNVELMERLLSGEGEPTTITPVYTEGPLADVGDEVYVDGPFGKQLVGRVVADPVNGGVLLERPYTEPYRPTNGLVMEVEMVKAVTESGFDVAHDEDGALHIVEAVAEALHADGWRMESFTHQGAEVVTVDLGTDPDVTATTVYHRDDAGKVTVVDDNDPFGLLDFLGEEG